MTLGQTIYKARLEKGLTLRELTDLSGVSGPHISRIENDISGAREDTWKKLAKALNLRYTPARLEEY